jgi:phage shock protein E
LSVAIAFPFVSFVVAMNPIAALLAAITLAAVPLFAQTADAPSAAVKNVTPDEAATALKERKDITVLDLRTAEEFKAGHIPGAKNIDFLGDDFAKQVATLDKSKTYLVHCAGGGRSTRSLKIFDEQKFSSLLHLNEGFKAWEKAGKPVEK